ncbi:MAG: hypothetical protein NVS3B21_00240 [Acidimicrobiales bacterium]
MSGSLGPETVEAVLDDGVLTTDNTLADQASIAALISGVFETAGTSDSVGEAMLTFAKSLDERTWVEFETDASPSCAPPLPPGTAGDDGRPRVPPPEGVQIGKRQ